MSAALEYSRLSPTGRGAILLIEIRGVRRQEFLGRLFSSAVDDRVRHGTFVGSDGEPIDDGMCIPLGDSTVVSLHGNPVLVDRFVAELRTAGARETPGRFPVQVEDRSRLRIEALELLGRTRTAAAAAFLLGQSDGGGQGLAAWRDRTLASGVAPTVDELDEILARAPLGAALFEPARVLLAGVPNAGKSTLFNHLLGQDRVVTHSTPGTTRDLIEELVSFGPFPLRLCDGAGLRQTSQHIEKEGVRRMMNAVTECDLVVFLNPVTGVASDDESQTVGDQIRKHAQRVIEIRSRCDEGRSQEGLHVSGVTGEGVLELERQVLMALHGTVELPVAPTPFSRRHEEILSRAIEATRRQAWKTRILEPL